MKKAVQLFILALMLLIPLWLGYKQRAEAKQEQEVSVIHIVEPPIIIVEMPDPEPSICEVVVEVAEVSVNEKELELLAHLIFAEAGSDWCSDKMQQYVGSVVLNRMASSYYPDTMQEVIYQKGQYSCTWNGMIEYEYNDRAYECAKFLLENGSVLPENVIFQAQFEQGDGIYEKVQNMYFCYKD